MMKVSQEFRALGEETLVEYIKETPALMAKLGNRLEGLKVEEIGDGKINFVYAVVGTDGSFVVKQAVPYVRSAGESLPMTAERAYFEAQALKEHGRLCPNHVPEVYHTDRSLSLTAMRYLEPPHIILRQGLRAGIEYPLLAEHMSEYLARTLYFTSLLYRSTSEHKRSVVEFLGNAELCRLTEKYTFSYPYAASQDNPFVPNASQNNCSHDNDAEAVHQDDDLKLELAELKSMFCERAQALLHADLHTGSVMVTAESTKVIDPEFAFYGPMGFDVGTFLGNLMMAFFAQDALANEENDRKECKQWILKIVEETWNLFEKKFVSLWDEHKDGNGEAYLPDIYNSPKLQILAQNKYMKDLFHDSLGFCGATLISFVSLCYFEDMELITDASKRACCERRSLNLAKILLKERRRFESIGQVISVIQDIAST